MREAERSGWIGGGSLDDLVEREAKVQKLGERRREVEDRAVDVVLMHVAGNGVEEQYGLAGVAYELLAGHPPFPADSNNAFRRQALNDPVPNIATVSEKVNNVLRQGLAKSPRDRFETCAEFADAFTSALE